MSEILICERPDVVSYDTILSVISEAHKAAQGGKLEFHTSELSANGIEQRIEKNGKCFVAMDKDKVVGTASVTKEQLDGWYWKGEAFAIRYVAILPSYSGRHIANRLYEAAFEYAKNNKVYFCRMTMSEHNKHHFHVAKKFGFTAVDYQVYDNRNNGSIHFGYWLDGKQRSKIQAKILFELKRLYIKTKMTVKKIIRRK